MQPITTHIADALTQTLSQYKGLPKLTSLFTVFAAAIQNVENAIYALYLATPLQNAQGAQLDNIGGIIGLARNGLDDATYRVLLNGTVALNNSDATTNAVLNVIQLVWQPASIWIQDPNTDTANKHATPASLSLAICDPQTSLSLKATLLKILQASLPASVMLSQVDIITQQGAKTFAFAGPQPHVAGFGQGTYAVPLYANPLD